jgi:hypothetical protein
MARALTFALLIGILALVVRFGYDRLSTLGLFRTTLEPTLKRSRALTGTAGSEIKFIADTINAEDLHLDDVSGLIFAAVQEEDGSRAKWFPPLTGFADPSVLDTAKGGLRVIDPKVSWWRCGAMLGYAGNAGKGVGLGEEWGFVGMGS